MKTEKKIKLFCFGLFIVLLLQDNLIISSVGLSLFAWSLLTLLYWIEKKFAILELIIFVNYLQLVFAPYMYYHIIEYQGFTFFGSMSNTEGEYMMFALPAVLIIHLTLHFTFKKPLYHTQIISVLGKIKGNTSIGLMLFGMGLFAYAVGDFLPGSLGFVVFLMKQFIIIGAFYLWLSDFRFKHLTMLMVVGYLTLEAFREGMFIEFFAWIILIGSVILQNRKISYWLKLAMLVPGVFFVMTLQIVKQGYRTMTWKGDEKSITDIKAYVDLSKQALSSEHFVDIGSIALISRLNQGWIISAIMVHTKKMGTLRGSDFFRESMGVVLPRFIMPNKPVVNSQEKFFVFTGKLLTGKTTMSVGVLGDGYRNFGFWGAFIFVFLFSVFIKFVYVRIYEMARTYPSLILWIPFIFFYCFRAGASYYIIANWIVKSSVVVFMIFLVFRPFLRLPLNAYLKKLKKP